jgi:hypothetical protein
MSLTPAGAPIEGMNSQNFCRGNVLANDKADELRDDLIVMLSNIWSMMHYI